MNRSRAIVGIIAVLFIVGAVRFVAMKSGNEFRSVAELVWHIQRGGPSCSADLVVTPGRVAGRGPYFEAGDCARFDDVDVASFYWFPDGRAMEAYVDYQAEIVGSNKFEIRGVFGRNWFASVPDLETARAVQDAVGGELRGY